jgi:hypothetical protein
MLVINDIVVFVGSEPLDEQEATEANEQSLYQTGPGGDGGSNNTALNRLLDTFSGSKIQCVPKVKCQTLGNGYLGQNIEKIKNIFFFQKRSVYQTSAILNFLQNNFYLKKFSTDFYETLYVSLN